MYNTDLHIETSIQNVPIFVGWLLRTCPSITHITILPLQTDYLNHAPHIRKVHAFVWEDPESNPLEINITDDYETWYKTASPFAPSRESAQEVTLAT